MVAVVDPAAELRIEIGTAAPAGMTTGFVELHPATLGGQLDRGGKTGETGADDMHGARRRLSYEAVAQHQPELAGL